MEELLALLPIWSWFFSSEEDISHEKLDSTPFYKKFHSMSIKEFLEGEDVKANSLP